jgi:hypothetical protein
MGVRRAFDALTIGVARGASRISATPIRGAFDAQARRGLTNGPHGIAVGRARTRHAAAATLHVTRAVLAVRVLQTVDTAPVPGVAHAARAVARIDTLDTRASGDVTARSVRRAVAVVQTLHAATAALTGRLARLGAIDIGQALNAQVELGRATTRWLARAVAGRGARQRAGGEHAVAALVARAISRGAALDAGVAHTRRLAAAAVRVDQALPAGATGAKSALTGAVARRTALDTRAVDLGKQLERAALIQVAAASGHAQAEPRTQRHPECPVEAGHHGDGESASISRSASCRAKPPG